MDGGEEIECVTPALSMGPRGTVMTGGGFLSGRRLPLARGLLLPCSMGGNLSASEEAPAGHHLA
ncbi:hypothetical protein ACV347_31790, partial [Pseudomonas aeruginosa]